MCIHTAIACAILTTILEHESAVCAKAPRMFAGQVVTLLCRGNVGAWFVNGRYAGESADSAAECLAAAILDARGLDSWAHSAAPSVETLSQIFLS